MQAWETPLGFMKDIPGAVTVSYRYCADGYKKNETKCISDEMALAPLHQFVRVESRFVIHFCCFDTLTVNTGDTRFQITIRLSTHLPT